MNLSCQKNYPQKDPINVLVIIITINKAKFDHYYFILIFSLGSDKLYTEDISSIKWKFEDVRVILVIFSIPLAGAVL